MKTKTFRYLSVMMAALLLLIVEGCQQQTYEVVKPVPTELSMDAAKQYYEATKHRSKASTKYQFLWDLVKKIEIDGAPIITVPVVPAEGGNTILQIQNGQVSSSRVETGSAMFYLNGEGKITASITATELALTESLGKKPQKMYFFDWMDESLQSVWTFDNGIFVQAENALDDSRARTFLCIAEIYMIECGGGAQQGGGNNAPTGLGDPGEGCSWVLVGTMPCGAGGNGPGGGAPVTIQGLPSPFPSAPSGPPVVIGGGPGGLLPPTISQDIMTRIYVATKISSWQAKGVNVTDEERDWLFHNPVAVNPLDIFVGANLGAAVEKWSFGVLGNFIRSALSSDFEKRMFDRYWSGEGGTYHLTNAEFHDIITQGLPETSTAPTTYLNQSAFEQGWTWYHTERYNLALGRARIFIRASDNAAFGLTDTYDFNPLGSGEREMLNEIYTWIGGTFVTSRARSFNIIYP